MTRTEKDQLIDELAQILAEKNVVYLTDASGLDSDATTSLRRECNKKDIRVRVVKNTLLQQAMERTEGRDYAELYDVLKGQTALLVGDIGNAPARVLKEFRKKHDMPILKGAYVEEATYLGDENLELLTAIKSKEELIGDVIALLQSPAKNVIGALNSGGNTLSGLVKALQERG